MTKNVAVIAAVVLCALSAAGLEIQSYDVLLRVTDRGSATGTAKFQIANARPGEIAIPLGFKADNVRLIVAPAGTTMSADAFNRQTRLRLALPAAAAGDVSIAISFDVRGALYVPEPAAGQERVLPAGAWMLRQTLVATEPMTIQRYRCEVLFPENLRAHAVREALPAPGAKEAEPRVLLASISGVPGARLQAGPLLQGDTASMQIELVPRSHSPLWIICGVLLSALYLISFRNLVFGPPHDSAQQETEDDEELS